MSPLRAHLAGFLVPATLGIQALAVFSPFVPDLPQAPGTIARMTDSLGPHLLAASLLPVVLVALIGYRRMALTLAALALAGAVWIAADYMRMRSPAGTGSDLTVLWFNMLSENLTPPEELAAALIGSDADILMLGEAKPVEPVLDLLAERYPYRVGCTDVCSTLVLSRLPMTRGKVVGFPPVAPGRLIHIRVEPPGKQPLDLVAAHLLKPWYLGYTMGEEENFSAVLAHQTGALILAGDLNAASWSRRLRLLAAKGLKLEPHPVATWPVWAGAWGIPIDHILVRGGPRLSSIAPWGGGPLGSNHRGLIAHVALP